MYGTAPSMRSPNIMELSLYKGLIPEFGIAVNYVVLKQKKRYKNKIRHSKYSNFYYNIKTRKKYSILYL